MVKLRIQEYLGEGRVMQVATVNHGKPWICSVYYVTDDQQNLYWLSLPSRRHSSDIAADNTIAIAVAVKSDKPVIGIQAEGKAVVVNDPAQIQKIMKQYTERYNAGKDFYDNFIAGNNQHLLYKFTPQTYVLFDEVNYPQDARQEWPMAEHATIEA